MLKIITCIQRAFFTVILLVCGSVQAQDNFKKYEFDKDHTFVIWRVSHFGYSDVLGKFLAEGQLKFDSKNPTNSSIKVTININSLTTGIQKFDNKLQGRSYFDAENFPVATFTSQKIKRLDKKKAVILGMLTIRNITKQVMLRVELNNEGKHPLYNRHTMGFTAHATIKRSDFGMRAYIPAVSDKVKLEMQGEAIEEKPKKASKE